MDAALIISVSGKEETRLTANIMKGEKNGK